MRLTFLGTGTSQGVPMIGCECAVCRSDDPRDKRTRSSVLIEDDVSVLVDTPPEFRARAIQEGIRKIDAVVITHAHADHIMGFDDLRQIYDQRKRRKIPLYAMPDTMKRLSEIFYYAFDDSPGAPDYLRVKPHEVTAPFRIGSMTFTPFALPHGPMTTMGFSIEKNGRLQAAYLNDCATVPGEVVEKIKGIPTLIIDGLRDTPHPTHMNIAQAIETSRRIGAKKTYLTHLTHEKAHAAREKEMPRGFFIGYDGLKLDL